MDIIINVLGRTPRSGRCYGQKQLFEEVLPAVIRNLIPGTINLAQRHRIMAVDGNIVVGMMGGGGDTQDGARYDQQYCHIFRIENGVIAEIWEFFDTAQAEARLTVRLSMPVRNRAIPCAFNAGEARISL